MTPLRAVVLLLLAASVGGCGSHGAASHASSASTAAGGIIPPNLVTNADLAETQPGSPSHATLDWFQAVQFQDVASLRRLTTAAALKGLSDATLTSWLSAFGPGFPRPRITAASTDGATTSVRMLLLSYGVASRTPASTLPFTMRLARTAGSWLVSDIALLRTYAKLYHLSK